MNGLRLCPAQNHLCPHTGLLNSAWTLKKTSTLMSFISGVLLFSRGVPCWMKIRDTNWKMIIHISKELALLQYGRTLKTLFPEVKQTRHKWINITWFHLCEVLRGVKFIKTEGRSGDGRIRVGEGWCREGCGNGEFLLNGNRVSVWEDVKVLEVDGSCSCKTMWMYLMSLKWKPKNAKLYVMSILPPLFY